MCLTAVTFNFLKQNFIEVHGGRRRKKSQQVASPEHYLLPGNTALHQETLGTIVGVQGFTVNSDLIVSAAFHQSRVFL